MIWLSACGRPCLLAGAAAAAIEYAPRLAQPGAPIIALIRASRVGHARFLQRCFDGLTRQEGDSEAVNEGTRRMAQLRLAYTSAGPSATL
jgi:hypothetical protein